MSDLEKVLKDVVMGSVGAVAAVVEKGTELVQELVKKGEETVKANQGAADDLVRKGQNVMDSFAKAATDAYTGVKDAINEALKNVDSMSKEQREDLRRRLDELDAKETDLMRKAEEAARVTTEQGTDFVSEIREAVQRASADVQEAAHQAEEALRNDVPVITIDEEEKNDSTEG